MKSVLFLLAAGNPVDGTERARMAARAGPAAVKAALESELAKAEKAGDVEHEASIKQHLADYLSEVEEKKVALMQKHINRLAHILLEAIQRAKHDRVFSDRLAQRIHRG